MHFINKLINLIYNIYVLITTFSKRIILVNFNYENVSILNSNISYDNYRNKKNYNTLNDFIEYFIEYYVAYYIGDNLPKERDKLIEYKNLGYNKFVSHWIVYTQNKFILQ